MGKFSGKKVIGFLALAGLALGVYGCGNNADKGETSKSNDGDQVTLTFWRQEHDPEVKAMEQLIDSFEKENPNIKVKMEVKVDYETAIRTALAGGTAPDIMNIDGPTVASYAENQAIIPLDKYFETEGDKEDILKPVIESLTYQDQMYAAPLNDASLAMFYNIKLFEEKGIELPSQDVNEAWTWEETLAAAKKIRDPKKGIWGWGPAMGISSGEGQVFSMMPWIWQAGGEILSEDLTTASGYLDSPESKKALTFIKELTHKEGVAPKEDLQEGFANGKLGMVVAGPWEIARLKDAFPDFILGENYGVAPLWRGVEQVTPMGSWNMAITSQSKHPDEAWKFVNHVTGKDGSKVWYEGTSNLPARYSTLESFESLQEYPMNIYAEQAKDLARPRPVIPQYVSVSQALGDLFENLMIKDLDVDKAVGETVQVIDEAIKQE